MTAAEKYRALKQCGGIADLSERAKFHLTGADRGRFLNGQISNDVAKARHDQALHACVMSAKGKMSGDIYFATDVDFLRIDADASLRESMAARLERYIISDDVALVDVTDELALLHLPGVDLKIIPEAIVSNSRVIISNRFGVNGIDLIFARKNLPDFLAGLSVNLPILDEEILKVLRIEVGIPRWGFELSEEIIPVEAGLEKTAIDYGKGCYVGQEIISRLKSVGRVNKQLRGLVAAPDSRLQTGMRLFDSDGGERDAGWITTAGYSFGLARPAALGYVKRGVVSERLRAQRPGEDYSCEVEVRELPLIS